MSVHVPVPPSSIPSCSQYVRAQVLSPSSLLAMAVHVASGIEFLTSRRASCPTLPHSPRAGLYSSYHVVFPHCLRPHRAPPTIPARIIASRSPCDMISKANCTGVRELHHHHWCAVHTGIVHRDIAARNCLVGPNNMVKLSGSSYGVLRGRRAGEGWASPV